MTFSSGTLELGLGDFIVYSTLIGYSASAGLGAALASYLGVTAGLVPTMLHLALVEHRTIVPALPASIALGMVLLAGQRWMVRLLAHELASCSLFI